MAFPGGRLSVGSVAQIFGVPEYNAPAVLQIMEVKKMAPAPPKPGQSGQPQERYRLLLSDSEHFIPAMLTTQLNSMVQSGVVQALGCVRITDYICNNLPSKNLNSKIVVVLALEAASKPLDGLLGSPVEVSGAGASFHGAAPQAVGVPSGVTPSASTPQQSTSQPRAAMQPLVDAATGLTITPIKELDRYLNRWTIRARCSAKSEQRSFGQNGRLFSVTLVDETGEIRATMFNEALDKYFAVFREGDVYLISQGTLKFANKKFTSVKHAYELTLNQDSMIRPIEDNGSVPRILLEFVPIDNILEQKKDDMIDVIGVVMSSKEATTLPTKNGDKLKRSVSIGDNSGRQIELTLWEQQVSELDQIMAQHGENPVLALKGVRVSDFGGHSLSAVHGTVILPEPDVPNTTTVRQWFNGVQANGENVPSLTGGRGGGSGSVSRQKTLSSIQNEGLGMQDAPDFLTVPNVVITQIKRDGMGGAMEGKSVTLWYTACANEQCNGRKVQDIGGGNHECPNCKAVNHMRLRWVLNCTAFDHTGKAFLSGFGDAGKTILGYDPEYVSDLKDKVDDYNFARVYEEARFKTYTVRLSVRSDTWEGTPRIKTSISSLTPIDYIEDSKVLLSRIDELAKK